MGQGISDTLRLIFKFLLIFETPKVTLKGFKGSKVCSQVDDGRLKYEDYLYLDKFR